MRIRSETPADADAIGRVTTAAFADMAISKHTEQYIVAALRKAGALTVSPGYYRRFGFRNIPALVHEGIPQEVFLALPFGDEVPRGIVTFHEGFQAEA